MSGTQKIEQLRRGSTVYLGADPEIFVTRTTKDGKELVVGSERVIPDHKTASGIPGLARDGIQIEFHYPSGITCRQTFAASVADGFVRLSQQINALNQQPQKFLKNLKVSFKQMVKVTPGEFARLSPDSRVLGCSPSLNIYEDEKKDLGVDPGTYPYRSAGGHIHLGLDSLLRNTKDVKRIIQVLDIMLGNTCVMMDLDPSQAERRKVYGRAGEYRMPTYGLEYRTLSNFWLRSYPLTSIVFSIARMAVQVIAQTNGNFKNWVGDQYNCNMEKLLLDRVDITSIRKAINTNDLKLAKENFKGVEEFIRKYTTSYGDAVNANNINQFKFFLEKIEEKGLEFWFPDDPITHWTKKGYMSNYGCENFLNSLVYQKMNESKVSRPSF